MILEVVVVVVRQQYCKARYLQVGRELEKKSLGAMWLIARF